MTMRRAPSRWRRAWHASLQLPCVLCLLACSEGYPTEDAPRLDPASMTQAQLLVALNALGKEPQLGKRWRYALHDRCELEVSVRNGEVNHHRVPLEGAEVTTRTADGITEVVLAPTLDSGLQAITVLETKRWSDTVRVRSLLTHLEVRCGRPTLPAASRSIPSGAIAPAPRPWSG